MIHQTRELHKIVGWGWRSMCIYKFVFGKNLSFVNSFIRQTIIFKQRTKRQRDKHSQSTMVKEIIYHLNTYPQYFLIVVARKIVYSWTAKCSSKELRCNLGLMKFLFQKPTARPLISVYFHKRMVVLLLLRTYDRNKQKKTFAFSLLLSPVVVLLYLSVKQI